MKSTRRILPREIALWAALAALGYALYAEWARIPEVEHDVVEYAQIAASASQAMASDWIVQVEFRAREVESDARDAMKSLEQQQEKRANKKRGQ